MFLLLPGAVIPLQGLSYQPRRPLHVSHLQFPCYCFHAVMYLNGVAASLLAFLAPVIFTGTVNRNHCFQGAIPHSPPPHHLLGKFHGNFSYGISWAMEQCSHNLSQTCTQCTQEALLLHLPSSEEGEGEAGLGSQSMLTCPFGWIL